jgi:solute carrier family 13 (sodium-dependent dicarboxylate transporter), member 2/3/5
VITETVTEPTTGRLPAPRSYLLKLVPGPLVFLGILMLPLALEYQGRVALATFGCVIAWWITQPFPWAVASMLPFVVFPAAGVMDIAATMRLYGQPIFFWIMGTVLMGYAIEKHGLARRIALGFLALPGVGTKAHRLTFTYMLMVGVVSMFVSDAATVAMMIPIGMSVVRHVRSVTVGRSAAAHGGLSNLATFITLGTLYAAVAGGTATMMGVPHNAVAVSMLGRLTGRQLGFFEWMVVGVPVFLALLVTFFVSLWAMARPELQDLPGGEEFLRAERAKLGPLQSNERRVLFVFAAMVLMFVLPSFVGLALGSTHPAMAAVNRGLSIWVVPPAVMLLLFGIRSTEPGAALLTWKDAEQQAPWNIMILVAAGVAMTDAITEFGFVEMMGTAIGGLGIGAVTLPYLVAALVAATTNMISGTAAATLYCGIFIPAAAEIGYNPASMAILIANVAIGVAFPWAGATSASAFAGGEVDMRQMVRIGLVATAIFSVIVATIHLMMAGMV